jgi:hypothetical protein
VRRIRRVTRREHPADAFDTPEDVAGHLARLAILPVLLAAVRTGCREAYEVGMRGLLRGDPGRYVQPQLQHGMALELPPGEPDGPTAPSLGLPRETWRETAARRRRCAALLERLAGPEPLGVCDLVTANLDLTRLAQDGLARWPGKSLALVFWQALERTTVLDPTCGSGAFLVAAAQALEPLYEACLARMEALGAVCPEIRTVLARAAAAPSRGAFLRQSILRDNLHGVDILPEAVERCRDRLARLDPGSSGNLRVGDALLELDWSRAFPEVMAAGGFQVVLGNPPFGRIPRDASRPKLRAAYWSARPRWSPDESLATLAVERCLHLLKPGTGHLGLVLPLAVACSTEPGFATLRRVIAAEPGLWLWAHFDRTPNALFGRRVRTRCTLALHARSPELQGHQSATTGLLRWNAEARAHLFATLHYARLGLDISPGIPKVANQAQADVLQDLLAAGPPLGMDLRPGAPAEPGSTVFVGGSAYNWFPAWRDLPASLDRHGESAPPARAAAFGCASEERADLVFALLCSALGYWWWAVASDGFNLKQWLVLRFPLALSAIPGPAQLELARLGRSLRLELRKHPVLKVNRGRIGNFQLPACAAETLAIDRCLGAAVPGLSPAFMDDIRASNASFARKAV